MVAEASRQGATRAALVRATGLTSERIANWLKNPAQAPARRLSVVKSAETIPNIPKKTAPSLALRFRSGTVLEINDLSGSIADLIVAICKSEVEHATSR
jgi:hypothetical protein